MKFFHINNSLCTDCGRCSELCPTGAIYSNSGKKYINYDKCTACGTCIKQCNMGAINIESLANVTLELERVELYKSRVQNLEHELLQSKANARDMELLLSDIVMQSPIATFIVDRNNTILIANSPFTELLSVDPLQLVQMPRNLHGESLENMLSEQIIKLIRLSALQEQSSCEVVQLGERVVTVSVSMLANGAMIGFMRDMSDRSGVGEQIVAQLKETIDRKMSMVQKIGFLLGEEVSVVVNNLNSVIKIIESSSNSSDGK